MKFPKMSFLGSGKYRRLINTLYFLFFGGILFFLTYLLAVNMNLFWLFGKMPSVEDLDNPKSEIASEIISSDGKVLGKYFYENRSPATFDEISPNVINALIATEDVRFTKHSGIDPRSMVRVLKGVLTFNRQGGGSTITQQLAKNLFKLRNDDSFEGILYNVPLVKTLIIKSKEWITAVKLERRYTKKEIMKMYLDTIEFSSGAHGIKSAAKTYFQKDPSKLTMEEAALLVGMIQNPSRFNPKFHPEAAKTRRNTVLSQMKKYEKITPEEFEKFSAKPIVLNYSPDSHNNGPAPYFRDYLKSWAKNELKKMGYDPNDLYTKGFKIYTTIDSRMQQYAEEAMEEHMREQQKNFYAHWGNKNPWVQRKNANSSASYEEIPGFIENVAKRTQRYRALSRKFDGDEKQILAEMDKKVDMTIFSWKGQIDTLMSPMDSIRYYKKILNMGMLAMDPRNGHIKAWVGGINFKYFKYDHVEQAKRQPGSTFKPFVYATAIDNGFSTCDPVTDEPVTFGVADGLSGGSYTPKNADGKYSYQTMTLRRALAKSINSISARLVKQFKPEAVIRMAHQLGIKSELPNSPSISLGVGDVSLYELLSGYAVFANGGKYTEPLFVTRIEDKHGELIREYLPDQKEVLSAETAYKMVHMLRGGVQAGGTSAGLARYGIVDGNEIGGKTGTTSNYSDGWYVGVTQNLIAGVWSGADDRAIHFRTLAYGQGGRMAMPAFGIFMKKVYADKKIGLEKTKFEIPDGMRITGDCVMSSSDTYTLDSAHTMPPPTLIKPDDDDEML